jgi:tetratricopeptide (TPR) repeat protein
MVGTDFGPSERTWTMAHGDETVMFLRTLTKAEQAMADDSWDEAAAHWADVIEVNPVDGHFWTQLATARRRLEDHQGAIVAFERAFDLGDGFPAETAYAIGCCHARLGNEEQAMAWLERAWDLGFRHVEDARKESDLTPLHGNARFREMVALDDLTSLSREDGWRADVWFLMREMKRRAYSPFRYQSEAAFDAAAEALIASLPQMTDAQVIVELTRLLRPLGDGHARVKPPREREDLQRAAPVQFYLFEEGLFVVAASPRHEDLLGARVTMFGDRSVEDVIATVGAILSRDNENEQWIREGLLPRLREVPTLHALGLIADPDRVSLTIQDLDGQTRTTVIATDADHPAWKLREAFPAPEGWQFFPETLNEPLPLYLRNAGAPYWFQHLPEERTVYFQFNSVRDAPGEPLSAFTERLFGFIDEQNVEKLVVDMRWNDGGNTQLELPLLHRIVGSRKINRRGALFVIIGRRTFSAAQNGVSFLDLHTEAIFVGEPTGSSPTFVGETSEFELPYSKVQVNVSDLRWVGTWPADFRKWIAPTLYAPPTFAAYRTNRDPAMEAVLAYRERLPGR